MNNKPIITIITPVYNGEKFIEETINSVLTHASKINFEYIIINDGSSDLTSVILNEKFRHLKIINVENGGEANAVNLGLKNSNGKYALIVNADDPLISSELFDISIKLLESKSNLAATYPDWQIIDKDGKVTSQITTEEFELSNLIGKCKCLPGPGAIFRVANALEINGRNKNYKFVSDYDFWIRLSVTGDFQRIPRTLAQWRMHEESASVSNKNALMAYERIEVISSFLNKYKIERRIEVDARANSYYLAARLCYFDKKISARKFLLKSFAIKKGKPTLARYSVIFYIALLPLSRIINFFLRNKVANLVKY